MPTHGDQGDGNGDGKRMLSLKVASKRVRALNRLGRTGNVSARKDIGVQRAVSVVNTESIKEQNESTWKGRLGRATHHASFTTIDLLATLYALFSSPVQDFGLTVDADGFMLFLTIFVFILFVAETIALSIVEEGYILGTYFWLDVVSTASLILDMVPSTHSIIIVGTQDADGVDTGYIARLGGRLGRTVRLVRLFRQLRLLKMLTSTKNETKVHPDGDEDTLVATEKKKSAAATEADFENLVNSVAESNSLRVVLILLTSVVAMSLLQAPCTDSTWPDTLRVLSKTVATSKGSTREAVVDEFRSVHGSDLLYLKLNKTIYVKWEGISPTELRWNQWQEVKIIDSELGFDADAAFDLRQPVAVEAGFTVGIIFVISFFLVLFSLLLSLDAVKLLKDPLEKVHKHQAFSSSLVNLLRFITANDDIDQIAEHVVVTAKNLLSAEVVNLYFVDTISNSLLCKHMAADKNMKKEDGFSYRLDLRTSSSSVAKVVSSGLPVYLPGPEAAAHMLGKPFVARNVLASPVYNRVGAVIAVVEVANKYGTKGFENYDENVLNAFCDQLCAIISRKATDAVFSNLHSALDESSKDMLNQYKAPVILRAKSISAPEEVPHSNRRASVGFKELESMKSPEDRAMLEERRLRLENIADVVAALSKWDTRIFDYSKDQLVYATVSMINSTGLLRLHGISKNKLLNFCEVVKSTYVDEKLVQYHNFYHGFNVFQVCFFFLRDTRVTDYLHTLDRLGLMLGAFCHDIGHSGVNNGFHINSYENDPVISGLAVRYNDISVLENMHASLAFQKMATPETSIFENLSRDEKKQVRTVMCKGILATDMAHHMTHVKAFQQKSEFTDSHDDRIMIVEILLHSADLSNPTQPKDNSVEWALLVADEFRSQVAKEKEHGLPVTKFMDFKGELSAENPNIAKLNIGFIDFVVAPLWQTLAEFLPSLKERVECMHSNKACWQVVANKTQ